MDYISINKDSWNKRTAVHIDSEFYDNESFIAGKSPLNAIELELMGDITGKKILHLQCHFGQDTIALNRMGAEVTGVDLSDQAIIAAEDLAKKTGSTARFICCDIYDLPNHLDETFDMVFTTYGTIGWLPDMNRWAEVVSKFLKPSGELIFVEFHPVVWMFDDDFKFIQYNYFNDGPITTNETSYAEKTSDDTEDFVSWNHSISEVVNNLLKHGMVIKALNEYNYSPYDCFNETVKLDERQYRIKHLDDKIPMVYAIKATKS